ncbi:MAG: hypothetical protein AB1696_04140 [Planctomycetota bacterium]
MVQPELCVLDYRLPKQQSGEQMANQLDSWIEDVIQKSKSVDPESELEGELVHLLVKMCYENKQISPNGVGQLLASAFDLLVAAQYYSALSHAGWLYCPRETPRFFFHYTNCCPRHVLNNEFYFSPSQKPQSGRIGNATSRLLLLFYNAIFASLGKKEQVLKGGEPVDAVVVNRDKNVVLFAEIKASPLMTPSLSMIAQKMTKEVNGKVVALEDHTAVSNSNFLGTELEMLIPGKYDAGWQERYFELGKRANQGHDTWALDGLIRLLKKDDSFFREYFAFWQEALGAYHPKSREGIFWLTNACGTPSPVPSGWPERRNGDGYESVSDSKTSVGIDRTDDIKKGIYQVLKIGSEGKPKADKWRFKVGLISNIHAARHFDDYLESLKDIVWTLDASGKARKVSDLPGDQKLYNLFDGIIALTRTVARDDWIKSVFGELG